MSKNLWRLFVVIALLFGAIAIKHPTVAKAQQEEPTHEPVVCGNYLVNECQVLSPQEIATLQADADFWGLYISNGDNSYRYKGEITRVPNQAGWNTFGQINAVPSEIRVRRDSWTSIPQMGIYWWKNQLLVTKPGYLLEGEIPTPLPAKGGTNPVEEIGVPDWNNFSVTESSSWDRGKILVWAFVPELTEKEVILHVFDVYAGFLESVESIPLPVEYEYTNVASVDWIPGEDLEVVSVNTNARLVQPFWEETWDWSDVDWVYEDDHERFIKAGFTEAQAREAVRLMYEADKLEFSNVYPNYLNTEWTATVEWTDNFDVKRRDGKVYRIENDRLYTWKACEEWCYSTSYTPVVGGHIYVDPYTFWYNDTDAALWTTNVTPAREILEKDQELLEKRLAAGEITEQLSVVTGIYDKDWDDDGQIDSKLVNTNNGPIDLPILYLPPMGTAVYVYTYTKTSQAPNMDLAWDVMALKDARGDLWFFNTEAEYGSGFDAETYNVDNDE